MSGDGGGVGVHCVLTDEICMMIPLYAAVSRSTPVIHCNTFCPVPTSCDRKSKASRDIS